MKRPMINYAKNKKYDHFDTPEYAVKPLLPFVNSNAVVWEPTDTTGKSLITKVLRKHGCKVISTGQKKIDFLKDEPDFNFNCIITNPPYSLKNKFIDRCFYYTGYYQIKWAMLLPITALEGVERGIMFNNMGTDFGVLVLNRRVEFIGKSSWFNSSWFCYGLLPKQLAFASLEKK